MSEAAEKLLPPTEVLEDMPYQAVPPMADEKYQRLAEDIKERGVIQPIITDEEDNILDGHHRAAIAEQLDLDDSRKPTYVVLGDLEDDRSKLARAIKTNLLGRDIDQGVKSEAVKQYIETTWPTDDETGALVRTETNVEVGDALGVSEALVRGVCKNRNGAIITHARVEARDYYREHPDASYREVARHVDASNKTVTEWLKEDFDEGDDEDEDDESEQPALNLFSRDEDEAEKAQDLAQQSEEDDEASEQAERVANKEATVNQAEDEFEFRKGRQEQERQKEERREQCRQEFREATEGDTIEVMEGDFTEVLSEFESGSIDHIVTDPPYDEDALDAWNALGREAARILPDDGFLVAYSGKAHLPEIYDTLSDHLDYYWQFIVHHQGAGAKIFSRTLRTNYKPVLVFTPSDGGLPDREDFVPDVIEGGGREKDDHDWQQAESEAATLIEAFTEPNDRILDPMAGSGTTGVVCQRLDRRCVLIDKDPDAIKAIYRRCADES